MDNIEKLIASLGGRDSAKSIQTLVKIGAPSVELLIRTLSSPDRSKRLLAATCLEQIGDARAFEPLISVMNNIDEIFDVRATAVTALGNLGDKRAIEPLIALLEHPRAQMRYHAVRALEKIGDERSISQIEQLMLKDKDQIFNESISEAAKDALVAIRRRMKNR